MCRFCSGLGYTVLTSEPAMSRILLTFFGALVSGATFWIVLGSLAAIVFTKAHGPREGAAAMSGFFFVGGFCGLVGLILGGWLTWRLLATPERMGAVALGLGAILVVLIIGGVIALRPQVVEPADYPGKQAVFEVEVSFPEAEIAALSGKDRLEFQLRSGDGTETAAWKRDRIRHEAGRAIVPGAFPTRAFPRTKMFAVMKGDDQLMSATLNVDGPVEATTDWSPWQTMEEGLLARWRLVVTPRP
jgi:MFS family permease